MHIMKIKKTAFWILMGVAIMGILSSIYLFWIGKNFGTYFLAGFSGMAIIGHALRNYITNSDS